MNKTQQIIKYKEANPTHKPSDIAKACGVKNTYVYQVLNNAKKKAKKDLKPVAPTEGQLTLRKEIDRLHAEIANMKILNDVNDLLITEHEDQLKQLENDVIGYRAVISYLQGQIDGLTV
jgi:tRNA A37 N6-isopentenylltransferase MiaA